MDTYVPTLRHELEEQRWVLYGEMIRHTTGPCIRCAQAAFVGFVDDMGWPVQNHPCPEMRKLVQAYYAKDAEIMLVVGRAQD